MFQAGSGGSFIKLSSDDSVDTTTHDFRIKFQPAINLKGADRWECALVNLNTWFTTYNISDDYQNRQVKYYNGSTWKEFAIDSGNYSADDLVAYIESAIADLGDDPDNLVLTPNLNTGKFVLTVAGGYKLDTSVDNLYITLGAEPMVYDASGSFPNQAEITFQVNSWNLQVSCIAGGFSGNGNHRIITEFVPSLFTPPGGNIDIVPSWSQYVLMEHADQINEIHVRLLDQRGRPLNINGQPLSCMLHMRPIFKKHK